MMACPRAEILFLAGRMVDRDEIRSHAALTERLHRLGFRTRLICPSIGSEHGIANLTEWPALGRRWWFPWSSRGLDQAVGITPTPRHPVWLHILGTSMADAGLDLAERWHLPYVLAVDEFPRREARLRLSRARCRGLIATNHELAEALVRDYGVPPDFLWIVPRGIAEPDRSRPAPRTNRVPVIGAVGPLIPGSGFATFLNAARRVIDMGFDAEFLLAGQGEGETDLRRRAERLRIADRFTFVDDKTARLTFWDVLDVFCQTSVSPTAGRSLAVAQAHGVPTIASDVEGLRSLVDGENWGLRIPHGDPGLLAQAIATLLSSPSQAARLSEAGRAAVLRDHNPDREAERLAELYNQRLDRQLDHPAAIHPPTDQAGRAAVATPEASVHSEEVGTSEANAERATDPCS